ncbi:MAG: FG-GAP repeat protein, partial [Flavobacteriaceae bacterium]|nr:FG-GAP repeat protein [Flavobacteriaceae bacterium]
MIKQIYIACLLVLSAQVLQSQVGVNTTTPDPSAILDLESTTQGFLTPVMTNLEINAIVNPAEGLIAFSADENCLMNFNGTKWMNVCTGAGMVLPLGSMSSKLKANDVGNWDAFGFSVSMSSDGTKVAVGAYGEDSDAFGNGDLLSSSGTVYIFSKSGESWTQEAKLKADNAGSFDYFGFSISMNSNGTIVAVGAYREDSNAAGIGDLYSNSGALYVFTYTNGSWTQEAKLKANDMEDGDYFGYAVAVNGDGNKVAVGSRYEDSDAAGNGNSTSQSGAVYIFSKTGTSWAQEGKLKANNADSGDNFGCSVAMSSDGTKVAVGAYGEDSDASGIGDDLSSSGAVYIFSKTGASWLQEAKLKGENTGADDEFGCSVSMSSDGTKMAVGAFLEDSEATGNGDGLSSS